MLFSHKKNKIMPFAATWMGLETVILNEVREGELLYDIPYIQNLKRNDTNELIKQKDSHTERMNLQLPGHTAIFKMDNQQGPTL